MMRYALAYAAVGWLVSPAVASGEKKSYKSAKYSNGARWGATTDPAQIRADFARWPDANIAVVCGPDSGIFVVDVDTKEGHGVDGFAALNELQAKHGRLPDTLTSISPSDSPHYYFNYPAGIRIANSEGDIGPGIDVRGDGGMVLAPPSLRPGKGRYRWLHRAPVADAPPWLIKLAQKPKPTISERALASIRPIVLDCQSGAYGRAAQS
jgi:putative DNA primase/helicase